MSKASTNYFYKIKELFTSIADIITALDYKAAATHNHDQDYLAADTQILDETDFKTINGSSIVGTGDMMFPATDHNHDDLYLKLAQVQATSLYF